MNSARELFPAGKNTLISWQFVLLNILLIALVGVMLEKPSGSLSGRLALQQEGFNLYTYNVREHNVYAIAIGPRGPLSEERGVWVQPDGQFQIDRLPVGEYTLRLHVPGFATSYDTGIYIEEGQVTKLDHDIVLNLIEPSVNMASNMRVFTTSEQPRFWINASGAARAVVKVYDKSMLSLLKEKTREKTGFDISSDLSLYKPYGDSDKTKAEEFFKKLTPVQRWVRPLTSDSEDWSHEEFKFDKPLPPGDYFAVAEVFNAKDGSDSSMLWFSVTDIGLVVKTDPEKIVARAIDLKTMRPRSNVEIKVFQGRAPLTQVATGKTGADGFAKVIIPDQYRGGSDYVVYGTQGTSHAYGGLNYYSGESSRWETYFYTDRPVYRLGQTVYWKGISRERKTSGFKNPGSGLQLHATIEDPDSVKLWEGDIVTSKHGTFHGVFDIPKESKTGAYQMIIRYPDGGDSYERFEVAEYRKPEYKVEVLPSLPRINAGQKAKMRIRATYYFGAPVTNAKVKYTVFSSTDWDTRWRMMDNPDYYDFYRDWSYEDYGSGYNGDYVTEGTAMTDANGEAVVQFDTKANAGTTGSSPYQESNAMRYKVDAEVTDISRIAVMGSGTLSVTDGDFALFSTSESYVTRVGEPVKGSVRAISYENNNAPVKQLPIRVKLWRYKYDRNRHVSKGEEVLEEQTICTNDKGEASVVFNTKTEFPTDTYYMTAGASDQHGYKIWDSASIWLVSQNSPWALNQDDASKEPLAIKLDKAVYKPGEKARVMITAPVTGSEKSQAIVAIEGEKLYSYQVVDLKATAQMVEVPLTIDYAPNVYVTVTYVGPKHQFYNQSEMIKVSPQERFLNLTVASDKPKYKPGEKATYTIKATYADGKPAANTEVSLGIVDESIYAIRAESAPDIKKFFYTKRYNNVQTICSFPEEYSGGPNKIEPKVRKDFKDTAAWFPSLITDKNGQAITSIKLPDNLTTWRATARAITMNTEVGWTIQKVVSTQDLILRLALPRFFTQGDESIVTAVVHNYSERPQAVQLTLGLSEQFKIKDSLVQKVLVHPEQAVRYSWPVNLVSSGDALVRCKAIGDTASDAMEMKLPIRPYGVKVATVKTGMIDSENMVLDLGTEKPINPAPGSVKFKLFLSSSTLGPLLTNFASLIDYPYGCTEQTMSKLMPSVVAMKIHRSLHAPLNKKDIDKFAEVYKQSMRKLDDHQHSDGGWGWWVDDDSNVYLTALVLEGYNLLKESGYKVEQTREANGRKWLRTEMPKLFKQLTDPLHKTSWSDRDAETDLAKGYYVLGLYKEPIPDTVKKWALQKADTFTPQTLSYFALAFAGGGDKEAARTIYDRLVSLANSTNSENASLMDWTPSEAMAKKFKTRPSASYYWLDSYRFTSVESTALALRAMIAVDGSDTTKIESIKRWVLSQRGPNGWDNTKTTSQVLRAFTEAETRQARDQAGTNFKTNLLLPGQAESVLDFGPNSLFEKEKEINLSGTADGKFKIQKQGAGRLYYTVVSEYYRQINPGERIAAKSQPNTLRVWREFFRLQPSAPDSNGNVHFKAIPISDGKIKAGETILMKVNVDTPISIPYALLEAPLPSGAEVVKDDSRADADEVSEDGKEQESGYDFGRMWWTHQDVLDDRLAFFVTDYSPSKSEFHQLMRVELPGKFKMNPVYIEGMYTNSIRGYSEINELTVVE